MGKRNDKNNKSAKESASTRITRSTAKLNEIKNLKKSKLVKKSDKLDKLKKLPRVSVTVKKIDSVEASPRSTRSKDKSKPAQKNDKVEHLEKLSPRTTRSKDKKAPIDVQSVAPTIELPKLKIVKRVDFVKTEIFKKNEIVLAKQKYSCPWPARILEVKKEKVLVYFFGDKRSGFVSASELYDFIKSLDALKSFLSSKKIPFGFIAGVREVELLLKINAINSVLNTSSSQ